MAEHDSHTDLLRTRIQDLKQQLRTLLDQRAALITQKKQTSAQISNLIHTANQHKEQRDILTKEIKALKEERDKLHTLLQEKQKKLPKDNTPLFIPPDRIKKKLNALNLKLETEITNFESEKKLMKLIHEVEQNYKNAQHQAEQ